MTPGIEKTIPKIKAIDAPGQCIALNNKPIQTKTAVVVFQTNDNFLILNHFIN